MGSEVRRLREELESLSVELGALQQRVRGVSQKLKDLEEASSEASFSLVGSSEGAACPAQGPSPTSKVSVSDTAARAALARENGKFLRRCLNGEPRGTSGRDRLALQNRCYIVLADYFGHRLQETAFFSAFQPVKELCKRGPDCGSSIFLGFATRGEAKAACQEAGVSIPEALRDA